MPYLIEKQFRALIHDNDVVDQPRSSQPGERPWWVARAAAKERRFVKYCQVMSSNVKEAVCGIGRPSASDPHFSGTPASPQPGAGRCVGPPQARSEAQRPLQAQHRRSSRGMAADPMRMMP